ncbi:MAG: pyruvate kinase [Gammaproteobacteria bacterium]|nr:pyruvate kinase [Gammaproteobacteria bacterium]
MTIDIEALCETLAAILKRAEKLEKKYATELSQVHPNFSDSARNLLHYIALRQFDIRDLQDQLSALGLSSLGRAEQHVLPSIRAVERALRGISSSDHGTPPPEPLLARADELNATHTKDLLGKRAEDRSVLIMVTLPTEASADYALVRDLISTGMNIARINCAHDAREDWRMMIDNIGRAREELSQECRIVMDLAGSKIRTGPLEPGPKVLRLRPKRDALGRVTAAKRIRCIAEYDFQHDRKANAVPVPQECVDSADVGDVIRFRDTRGRKRKLHVVGKDGNEIVVELYKTAFVVTGTRLTLIKHELREKKSFLVGELPATEQPIVLHVNDTLLLDASEALGAAATIDKDGKVTKSAHVRCIPAELVERVSVGDPVLLNDGKIEGTIESTTDDGLVVRITHAKATGSRLRSNRSINFPQSDLRAGGLSKTDKRDLDFVAQHADAVGMSFVREPAEVLELQDELGNYPDSGLGVILKIETKMAFRNLPRIMLAAMCHYPAGIMIARGDLAVECGWVQLAVIQEEILWLCEAAHMPVIWATQVLEDEAKKGLPTRAEISDAAMSQRADCVMLNKGPFILAAIRMLDDILRRMQKHQRKKKARLPKLKVSEI